MIRWPHWRDNTNIWFSAFLDFRKIGKFAASIKRPTAKSVSASKGLCSPDQGLYPWTLLRAPLPDPRYRLALLARHGLPPTFKYLPQSLHIHVYVYITVSKTPRCSCSAIDTIVKSAY